MSSFLTTGLSFPPTIWTFSSVYESNECKRSEPHVICLLEQPGILRTNIGLLMIYHQPPVMENKIKESKKVYFLPF